MGAVDTTYTFTATDTITSTKMNNIIDQTTITTDAIIGSTLEVATGKLKIRAAGITSNELGAGSVTTNAIADGAVTSAKLSTGGPVWTSSTGTITIPQSQLELGTGNQTSTASLIDFHSVYPSTDYEARIIRYAGTNGGMVIEQTGSGGMSLTSPSGFAFNSAPMPAPVGNAPLYSVRAFAKVAANGTVANNKGFSSISKTGTGVYNLILSVTPAEDPIVVATCHTPSGNAFNYSAAVQINSSGHFTVKTGFEDVPSLSDIAFSIMVIY